jgi:hypothetical protein
MPDQDDSERSAPTTESLIEQYKLVEERRRSFGRELVQTTSFAAALFPVAIGLSAEHEGARRLVCIVGAGLFAILGMLAHRLAVRQSDCEQLLDEIEGTLRESDPSAIVSMRSDAKPGVRRALVMLMWSVAAILSLTALVPDWMSSSEPVLAESPPLERCAFITDPNQIVDASVVDFEDLAIGPAETPLRIGDLEFSAGHGLGIADVSRWSANGSLVYRKTLIPFSNGEFQASGYAPITIRFLTPVQGIGLGWFDPNSDGNRFEAFDSAGRLIVRGAPSLGPPGGSHAAFTGAAGPDCNISSVVVTPASSADWYSIDNVKYSR